ncbi:RGS domain containing protein [Elaphomyces granulatus]
MAEESTLGQPPRNRLPTLSEVLNRYTLSPVDLYSFYIYMRDQQRSVDYLDFWLDVSQHMSLCRHYVRELRRSVLVATPELEKSGSKRSSAALENIGDIPLVEAGPSGFRTGNVDTTEKDADQRLSAFLRSEGHTSQASPQGSMDSARKVSTNERPPRPSFMNSSPDTKNDSNSPSHTVARSDIRRSAEKILYTYLLQNSEREIILPEDMASSITEMVESDGRDDPEVFDVAKDYVFQAMERDAFPGFLRAKALENLVPPSIVACLTFALTCFGGGFWAAFFVVLTDAPRNIRCWVILPFAIASYFLASYQYKIDPVMALAGFSECTFMNWLLIREPYVQSLLTKRATAALLISVLLTAALSILFILVPGKMI